MNRQTKYEQYDSRVCVGKDKYGSQGKLHEKEYMIRFI